MEFVLKTSENIKTIQNTKEGYRRWFFKSYLSRCWTISLGEREISSPIKLINIVFDEWNSESQRTLTILQTRHGGESNFLGIMPRRFDCGRKAGIKNSKKFTHLSSRLRIVILKRLYWKIRFLAATRRNVRWWMAKRRHSGDDWWWREWCFGFEGCGLFGDDGPGSGGFGRRTSYWIQIFRACRRIVMRAPSGE